jgi:hypothetical protein
MKTLNRPLAHWLQTAARVVLIQDPKQVAIANRLRVHASIMTNGDEHAVSGGIESYAVSRVLQSFAMTWLRPRYRNVSNGSFALAMDALQEPDLPHPHIFFTKVPRRAWLGLLDVLDNLEDDEHWQLLFGYAHDED